MSDSAFSRRTLLAGTGGAALLLGVPGLSACGNGSQGAGNTATANSCGGTPDLCALHRAEA